MRTIVTALLLCSALSAQLRASQGSDPSAAFLSMALKAYEGATGIFQGLLLRQLYGDNADTIQAQLNTCTENLVMSEAATFKADFEGLLTACNQPDPLAPAGKLMQDAFQSLGALAQPCPNLSVNLLGDLQTVIASAIVQGNSLVAPIQGPILQLSAPLLQQGPQYLQPLLQIAASAAQAAGVSQGTLGTLQGDSNAIQAAVAKALTDAAGNALSPDDLTAIANLGMKLAMDETMAAQEVLAGLMQFAETPAQAICSVMGPFIQPLLSLLPTSY